MTGLFVDCSDHVGRKIDDLLKILRGQVEQVAQPAGHALEVPDVGHGSSELDVPHALTAYLRAGDFDATTLTDDALEAHSLVLTAVALPVPGGTENLFAEQTIALGLERAVVDGLWLLDFTVTPVADVVRRGQPDLDLIEEIDVEHLGFFPRGSQVCG